MQNPDDFEQVNIVRSSAFLFLTSFSSTSMGLLFWVCLSWLTGPEIVGFTSSTTVLVSMVAGITLMGIPSGSRRHLGVERLSGRMDRFKAVVIMSVALVILSTSVAVFVMTAFLSSISSILGLPLDFILIAEVLLFFTTLSATLKGIFVANLSTGHILVAEVTGSSLRIMLGILLVWLGLGAFGALSGYAIGIITVFVVLSFSAYRLLKRFESKEQDSTQVAKEIMHSSVPSWPSNILTVLGSQLSVLLVQSFSGPTQSGLYFIAFAILTLVLAVPISVTETAFPFLSGMTYGRNEAAAKALRLAVAVASPIAAYLYTFPGILLAVFGHQFLGASLMVSLLVLGVIPSAIFEALLALVYAEGRYLSVLLLGVSLNAPRMVLYFFLIPIMQGVGAAVAYLCGSIFGLLVAAILIRDRSSSLLSGRVFLGVLLPFSVCILCLILGLSWLVSGCILLLLVLFAFTRLHIVERSEIEIVLRAVIGKDMAKLVLGRLSHFLDFVYGV